MLTPNLVFRDFVTDGVPSSGVYLPPKADIRALLNTMAPTTGNSRNSFCAPTVGAEGTSVSFGAADITLYDANGAPTRLPGVNASASISGSGAGGIDGGTVQANTWYAVYVIWNPVAQQAALIFSTNMIGPPALPQNYTSWRRVSAAFADANGALVSVLQLGAEARYVVNGVGSATKYPQILVGASGSPVNPVSWTQVPLVQAAKGVPIVARAVKLGLFLKTAHTAMAVAPNGRFSHIADAACPPPAIAYLNGLDVGYGKCQQAELLLESSNIYAACNDASGVLMVLGWTDAWFE